MTVDFQSRVVTPAVRCMNETNIAQKADVELLMHLLWNTLEMKEMVLQWETEKWNLSAV